MGSIWPDLERKPCWGEVEAGKGAGLPRYEVDGNNPHLPSNSFVTSRRLLRPQEPLYLKGEMIQAPSQQAVPPEKLSC